MSICPYCLQKEKNFFFLQNVTNVIPTLGLLTRLKQV